MSTRALIGVLVLLSFSRPALAQVEGDFWNGGGIRIGDSTTTCDASIEGAIRYNNTTDVHQFCNATAWADIASGGGAIDDLTDAVTDYTTDHNMRLGSNTAIFNGGQYNVFIGESAGTAGTTNAMDLNTAVGHSSLSSLTSGSGNTALGGDTLQYTTSGSSNTAIGQSALGQQSTGNYNVALGDSALYLNDTGNGNIGIGYSAGSTTTSGNLNISIGYNVQPPSATADSQLNIGNTIYGNLATDFVGIGASIPGAKFHVLTTSTAGNASLEGIRIQHEDTNSAGANGLGAYISLVGESNSNGVFPELGRVESVLTDSVNTSKDSRLSFYTLGPNAGAGSNTATEKARLDSNGLLTLGTQSTSSPLVDSSFKMQVVQGNTAMMGGAGTFADLYMGYADSSAVGAAEHAFIRTRGTVTVPANLSDDDPMGFLTWQGFVGGGVEYGAEISAWVDGTPGTSDMPTRLEFGTTPDGSDTTVMRMVINNAGHIGMGGNASPNVALDVTGDIEYTGVTTDVSDRRLKENISPFKTSLAKVLALQPVTFVMKDDPQKRVEYGFIAQDIQPLYPDLVKVAPDEQGTLSLNYIGLIAPLIKAVQEQQDQITALQQRIKALEEERNK